MPETPPRLTFSSLLRAAAGHAGDRPAVVQGSRRVSWTEFTDDVGRLAGALRRAGLRSGATVGLHLHSSPEYLLAWWACADASLASFNVNFRYRGGEVAHLLRDAGAAMHIFGSSLAGTVAEARETAPADCVWVCVDDGAGSCPPWATPMQDLLDSGDGATSTPDPQPDDIMLLYTGGTTGMPKGVMWRYDDILAFLLAGRHAVAQTPLATTIAEYTASLDDIAPNVGLVVAPLMHGTGLLNAVGTLLGGGTLVLLPSRSFDPAEMLDVTVAESVTAWAITGDPVARPLVDRLDAEPDRWDLGGLTYVGSSAAMWSQTVKQRLLRHAPNAMLFDHFSSSEALGMGVAVSGGGLEAGTARFTPGPTAVVLDDSGRPVEPGSGEVGTVAVTGLLPVGYHGDPERTAAIMREVGGRRYVLSGDLATVAADGTIQLLGRGSTCINTGGEKVYAEEVEEVLKEVDGVRDALCLGIPHERWGSQVAAVLDVDAAVSDEAIVEHVRARLAGYKVPRRLVRAAVPRTASGKPDYEAARTLIPAESATR